jgi:hypothetical protein
MWRTLLPHALQSRSKPLCSTTVHSIRDLYDGELVRRLQPPDTAVMDWPGNDRLIQSLLVTSYPPVLSHMLPAFFETVATLSNKKAANELPYK